MSETDTAFAKTTPASQLTSATDSGEQRGHADAPFKPGDRIGERYVVRELLGRGGMGAVYRATDEKLGEDIALKVVRAGVLVRDEVRLAQKVTHPNVCRTYDLEEADGHQLVKMELVAGETLATRVARGPLAIDEAVRIARAIADGLAAAHARGIVHRDLKPGNVMLAGTRVVLMDFGIAAPVEQHFTSVAGTIGYMAPEQIANTEIDERADLYALGCLVYEMLAGAPVFGPGKPLEIAARHASYPAPDVRAARREVPRWLARAVASLLAKDRAARPAGLAKLRAGPFNRRRIALGGAGAVAFAGIAFVLVRGEPRSCEGFDRRMAGVWDAPTKLHVHERFLATKLPYAESSYRALERAIDGFADTWTTTAVDNCQATRVRNEQSEQLLELRMRCLEQRREDLRALIALLGDADAAIVDRGPLAAQSLYEQMPTCSSSSTLLEPGEPPYEHAAAITELRLHIPAVHAQLAVGNYLGALGATEKLLAQAKSIGWGGFEAELLIYRATATAALGNPDQAIELLEQATWIAMRERRDDWVAHAAYSAGSLIADVQSKPKEAQIWIDLGHAAAARYPDADEYTLMMGHTASGVVAEARGDINSAVAFHEQALNIAKLLYHGNEMMTAAMENNTGATFAKAGVCSKAIPLLEHALAMRQATLGPEHSELAMYLANLGNCYMHVGELAKARAACERSLRLRERIYGERSPILTVPLDNLAEVLDVEGDHEAALTAIRRAKRIAAVLPGTAHFNYHIIVSTEAEILGHMGKLTEARAGFDEALALENRSHSEAKATTLAYRAMLELDDSRWADAERFARASIDELEAASGPEHPELWRPLTALGRARAGQNDPAGARAAFERALAIATKAQVSDYDLVPTRAALASLLR